MSTKKTNNCELKLLKGSKLINSIKHSSNPELHTVVEQKVDTDPDQKTASMTTQTEAAPVCIATGGGGASSYSDLSDLISNSSPNEHPRPLILQHGGLNADSDGATNYVNILYDLYGPSTITAALGTSPKDRVTDYLDSSPESERSTLSKRQSFPTDTVFRSQEKYVVTLGAPISIAQRQGEDTLTYLNKGQFYNITMKANSSVTLPERVKSVMYLTFFDEPDKKVEANHWQYWYNLQANPNQRAFDIDRKNCENIQGKPEDLSPNVTSFVWTPEIGSKVVFRINCLSTEFSSQKGVKGIPLYLVVETHENLESDEAEPAHRGYCKVKIFRDKGAERKNKDETKNVERRMQRIMKQQPAALYPTGMSLDSDLGPSSVFHQPNKETELTPTSTFGQKPFLFIPQPEGSALPPLKAAASSLLATIRERETKRTFSNTLSQANEDLDHLEVAVPAKKVAKVPRKAVTTIYVRKEEEKVYNALMLQSLTVHGLKLEVSKKYDIPADMIKNVYKKTKKGLLVNFDDYMISQFEDEDDFIIELEFDNQKGCFDLYIQY